MEGGQFCWNKSSVNATQLPLVSIKGGDQEAHQVDGYQIKSFANKRTDKYKNISNNKI